MRPTAEHSVEINLLIHGLVKLVKNGVNYLRNLEEHSDAAGHRSVQKSDSERPGNVSLRHFTKGLHFLQSFSGNPPGRDEILSNHKCIIHDCIVYHFHGNVLLADHLSLLGLLFLLLSQ
jgi:hypothetical protein